MHPPGQGVGGQGCCLPAPKTWPAGEAGRSACTLAAAADSAALSAVQRSERHMGGTTAWQASRRLHQQAGTDVMCHHEPDALLKSSNARNLNMYGWKSCEFGQSQVAQVSEV